MPPRKKVANKSSRVTKPAAPTRASLPRVAKSKSRYRTVHEVADPVDQDGTIFDSKTPDNRKAVEVKEEEPPATSGLVGKRLPTLVTSKTAVSMEDITIEKPKTPIAKIQKQEENLSAQADAVWALHRHHNHSHNHSPSQSPLRCYTQSPSTFPPLLRSRSPSSSIERFPGPPLADPRLSHTSNRRHLTQKAKFAARWVADPVAQANGVPLEEYTVSRNRPKLHGDDEEGVERWRPKVPVWEGVIREEDRRVWRGDEAVRGGGASLFDYTMRREKAGNGQGAGDAVVGDTILKSQSELEKSQTSCGRGSKDSSKYEPKVIEEEKQSSGSGSRLHGRTESLDESNDTGPLLSIASTTVPVTHEGRSERLSSLDKLFDTESISTTRSVMVLAAVQTREDDPPGDDALQDDLCDNLFDSLSESPKREISKLKLEWGTGKRAAVDLNPPSLPKPPDLSSSPVPSDWTSQLFTREELASMIDHEVQNVYLDCPHCNLIVRHGLPIPLPFELKEKCVCTFPRLQATGYRAQTSFKPIGKNGRRERMTLGDLEFEKALREKRVLIGEVIDRCVEEAKAAVSWETDTYSAQSKIEALTMSDVGGEMEPSLDVLEGREKMEEKEEKEGDGGDPVGAKKTMKGSSPAKKTSKVSTKAKKPQKRRPR